MLDLDIAQIKSKVLVTTLQIVNDPRVMKLLTYPGVMQAVTKGLAIKDKIDATIRIWTDDPSDEDL